MGEGLYWAATTLFQRLGAQILAVLMFVSGVLLLTGATVAGLLSRAGRAARSAGTGTRELAKTVRLAGSGSRAGEPGATRSRSRAPARPSRSRPRRWTASRRPGRRGRRRPRRRRVGDEEVDAAETTQFGPSRFARGPARADEPRAGARTGRRAATSSPRWATGAARSPSRTRSTTRCRRRRCSSAARATRARTLATARRSRRRCWRRCATSGSRRSCWGSSAGRT